MRVVHDGEQVALDLSQCAHLGDVIERFSAADVAVSRVVTHVRVDRCEIPDANLDQLEVFALEGVEEIEIETRDVREVALGSLDSSADYAAAVTRAVSTTVDHLRAGRIEQANRLHADVVDALGVLLFALTAAADTLGEEAEEIRGLDVELQPWLEELMGAQRAWDWLQMADYLEYEISPRIDTWRGRVADLADRSGGGG